MEKNETFNKIKEDLNERYEEYKVFEIKKVFSSAKGKHWAILIYTELETTHGLLKGYEYKDFEYLNQRGSFTAENEKDFLNYIDSWNKLNISLGKLKEYSL